MLRRYHRLTLRTIQFEFMATFSLCFVRKSFLLKKVLWKRFPLDFLSSDSAVTCETLLFSSFPSDSSVISRRHQKEYIRTLKFYHYRAVSWPFSRCDHASRLLHPGIHRELLSFLSPSESSVRGGIGALTVSVQFVNQPVPWTEPPWHASLARDISFHSTEG